MKELLSLIENIYIGTGNSWKLIATNIVSTQE